MASPPYLFKLRKTIAGYGGVLPFVPSLPLPAGITPFGITDSDIKGPTIPKPVPLFILNKLKFLSQAKTRPLPAVKLIISGITKDSTGAVLASCTVTLYRTTDNLVFERTTSDANGVYSFSAIGLSETYYVVAYKAGNPDVAGTTLNTLVGV